MKRETERGIIEDLNPAKMKMNGTKETVKEKEKTYNTGDSLVVTDPTTNPALSGLTRGERTGSRAFQMVWSYVEVKALFSPYMGRSLAGFSPPHITRGPAIPSTAQCQALI